MYIGLAILGTVLAAAALVSLTVLLLRRAFAPDAIWCELRPVSRRDAKAVCDLMRHAFGEETPSVTRILEWQRRNTTVMTAVYSKRLSGGKVVQTLVGVFKIVPLRGKAIALLEVEQLSGANLPPDFIAAPGEKPAAFYIGDILGVTSRARGDVLRGLFTAVKACARDGAPFYTRPLSLHGARLVRKYNFVPVVAALKVGALGRIHRLATIHDAPTRSDIKKLKGS